MRSLSRARQPCNSCPGCLAEWHSPLPYPQALRASLAESALQEDAAAAAQLEEAGWKLDSLADSLAELERQQGALQVRRLAAGGPGSVLSCLSKGWARQLPLTLRRAPDHPAKHPTELLQEERYSRFHSALAAVNGKLTGIYSRLTGGAGDAYCSYTQDRLGAFADGVTFHVRWAGRPTDNCALEGPWHGPRHMVAVMLAWHAVWGAILLPRTSGEPLVDTLAPRRKAWTSMRKPPSCHPPISF